MELSNLKAEESLCGHKARCPKLLDGSPDVESIPGGFGSFESSKEGKDEWLTPPHIITALGEFDLDPCSPVKRPWPTAKTHFTVFDRALTKEWFGRVWLNPPYGDKTIRFMRRLAAHGDGIALICARTETQMFFETVWPKAHAVFFFKGRLTFHHVDGSPSKNCIGAPSCLVAYGRENTLRISESGLCGYLIELIP